MKTKPSDCPAVLSLHQEFGQIKKTMFPSALKNSTSTTHAKDLISCM